VATLGISLRLAINGGKYDAVEQRETALIDPFRDRREVFEPRTGREFAGT